MGSILSALGNLGSTVGNMAGLFDFGFGVYDRFRQNWLQGKMWDREDDAVQRRVRDLRRAGLSPTLAAGSGAQAGPVVPLNNPGTRAVDSVRGMLDIQAQQIGLRKLEAEVGRTEADRQRAEAEAAIAKAKVPYADEMAKAEALVKSMGPEIARWRSGSMLNEYEMSMMRREMMEKFGMSNAQAEAALKTVEAALAEYYGSAEMKTGQSFARSWQGWSNALMPFLNLLLRSR